MAGTVNDAAQRSFGDLLRHHRKAAGLTQEELAERAELSVRQLANLESGRNTARLTTVRRLADSLRLTDDERAAFLQASDAVPLVLAPAELADGAAAQQMRIAHFPQIRTPTIGYQMPWRSRALAACGIVVLIAICLVLARSMIGRADQLRTVSTAARPMILTNLGTRITGPFPLSHIWTIDVLTDGRVAVLAYAGTPLAPTFWGIAELSPSGQLLSSWAAAPSRFMASGLATDGTKYIYAADNSHHSIHKFSADGTLLATWGSGLGLRSPARVAVDQRGDVWVADPDNGRLLKLSSSGRLLDSYGSLGSNSGQFQVPLGITFGRNGDVYVIDAALDRVTELTADGRAVRTWGTPGRAPGQFFDPSSIVADRGGNILVADRENQRIEKFTPTGRLVAVWGRKGYGPGEFMYPVGIAVGANGDVYVSDDRTATCQVSCGPDRIEVLSPSGKFLFQWTASVLRHTSLTNVAGLAVDSRGGVYATDAGTHRVVAFDPDHLPVLHWSGAGLDPEEDWSPSGIALDYSGHLLVTDTDNSRLLRYSAHGKVTRVLSSVGDQLGQLGFPKGVAVDRAGDIFVADTYNSRVQEFSPVGKFLRAWSATFANTDGPPSIKVPDGALAVDASGTVYVGNEGSMTVDRYSSSGRYLGPLGGAGVASGRLRSISGLAVDAQGRVYVADWKSGAICIFSPSRTLIARWQMSRFPNLGVARPRAIAVDRQGDIYIAGGTRIVELAPLS